MAGMLRWGTGDMIMTPRGIPGFLIVDFINLRAEPLRSIQVSLFPKDEIVFKLHPLPFALYPYEKGSVIIPYAASRPVHINIMVLFTCADDEILFLQEGLDLVDSNEEMLLKKSTWQEVIPLCFEGFVTLPNSYTPSDFEEVLSRGLHASLLTLDVPHSGILGEYSYVVYDPLIILSFTPPNELRVYSLDRTFLSQLERLLPGWLRLSDFSLRKAADLGQSLAIIKNYVDLGWKTDDMLSLARKIGNLLGDLRLFVPWPVVKIEKFLDGKDTLKKLSEDQISSLNSMISTVERHVLFE